MYELIDVEKSYILPNGKTVTGDFFFDNSQYPFVGSIDCVVDSSDGLVSSVLPLKKLLEDNGIQGIDDPNEGVSRLNASRNAEVTKNEVFTSIPYIKKAAQIVALTFTDEQAVEVADLYPEYEVGHEYKQNDRFQYGHSLYKVNQAHTSQEQWVPGEVGTESLYTNLMLNDAGYQIWKQPTGAHDAYNTGDVVEYNGTLYKSLIDGNAWAPDVYPAGWQEYDESTSTEPGTPEPGTPDPGTETYPDFVQPTGAHDAYKKGDIVRYNGKLYQSLIDANAYSPDAYPQGWQEYSEE